MKTDFDILELGQSDLRRIAEPVTDIQSTVFQQKIDALICETAWWYGNCRDSSRY